MGEKRGSIALIIGGLLMILGMFLAFVTVNDVSFSGSETNGEDGPYYVAGVVAILAGAALFKMRGSTGRKVVAGLTLLIVGFFGLFAAFTDITQIDDIAPGADASAGIGLYLAALGALLAVIGAILALIEKPRETVVTTAPTTTPTAPPPTQPPTV